MPDFRGALASAIALTCLACASPDGPSEPSPTFRDFGLAEPDTPPLLPLTQLAVPTYDGSGQAVHPDVVFFPHGWHGFEYWMAFTPYPGGQAQYENPSIAVSHDGKSWEVPAGLKNPIVRVPKSGAYNSDPDLSYDARNDRLVMLSREVRAGYNLITMLYSSDGVRWSRPTGEFMRQNHGMISPTMVLAPGRDPRIWYVDAGTKKCPKRVTRVMRQEGNGTSSQANRVVEHGWGPVRYSGLSQPGYFIWHIDVAWIEARKEYWAVYPAYAPRNCGTRDLFFARSSDGNTWTTYSVPLLRHEDQGWTSFMLYRASTLYDPERDAMRLYLSAAEEGPRWHLGVVEFKMTDLLAHLERGAPLPVISSRQAAGPRSLDEDALP